jgi:hypothetical protein
MTDGAVHLLIEGPIASVVFDRPQARNAMTWAMYERLMAICTQLQRQCLSACGDAFVVPVVKPLWPAPTSRSFSTSRAATTAWPTSARLTIALAF